TKQVTQAALNARPIKIPAGTDTHDRPGCLRRCTWADAFGRGVFVCAAGLAPAAVAVLATFEPVTSAQNPILRHVLADCPQAAQHLPRAIDVIHAPPSVPGTIVMPGGK